MTLLILMKTMPLLDEDDRLAPGTTLCEYRIESVVSEGVMSVVYAAVHPLIGKRAAIKVISHALSHNVIAADAFLQEALSVNQIRHPNIVDVFAFSTLVDGRSFFVMEWLDGETLRAAMSRPARFGRPMTMEQSCDVLIQVCEALDAAHSEHIVHLDLKPENVFLVPVRGGRIMVKLLDFGIAKHFRGDAGGRAPQDAMRQARIVAGTPTYMSPEQARGEELNAASDVYSLGVMAYEMFLGQPPFSSEVCNELLFAHVNDLPPDPRELWPDVPPLLEQLLLHMLAKRPGSRPSLVMVREWLSMLRNLPETRRDRDTFAKRAVRDDAQRDDPTTRRMELAVPRPPRRSHRRLAGALALSVAALLLVGGWTFYAHSSPAPPVFLPSVAPGNVQPMSDQGLEE